MAIFKSLAGPGYVVLNAVRVMNIIVLLTIAVACAVMLVKTSFTTNFFVFDATSHVIFASASRKYLARKGESVLVIMLPLSLTQLDASFPDCYRAQHLPLVLQPLLASPCARLRTHNSWSGHGYPGIVAFGRLE